MFAVVVTFYQWNTLGINTFCGVFPWNFYPISGQLFLLVKKLASALKDYLCQHCIYWYFTCLSFILYNHVCLCFFPPFFALLWSFVRFFSSHKLVTCNISSFILFFVFVFLWYCKDLTIIAFLHIIKSKRNDYDC